MSQDLNLRLRITGDGSGLKGELRTASGEVVKFGDTLESGAKRGTRALKETEKQTGSLGNTTQQLTRQLGALVAGYLSLRSVGALGHMADQYTNLNAQVRLVTTSAGEQVMVFEEVEDIAGRTGQALDTVNRLTTRTIRALISSGDSAAEATQRGLALTNVISNAVLVSGAGAAESNAAVIQLSQGLASGVLRGEEFNSVMEQTPRIAQALANALGLTLGQLRELAIEGGLTTEIVTEALLSQAETLEREAATIPPTIGRAWQALNNAVTVYVGEADAGIGASREVAESLHSVAENLDTVVDIAEILAVVIGTRLVLSLGAATKAKVIAIATSQAYRGALVGLAGMSNTAAAGQLALAAASKTFGGALALVGGPIGAVVLGIAGLAIALRGYRQDLLDSTETSAEAEAAINDLLLAASGEWDTSQVRSFEAAVGRLNAELEKSRDRLADTQQQAGALMAGPAGGLARFFDWITGASDEAREEIEALEAKSAQFLETLRARQQIADQFGSADERYALGAEKIAQASEVAIDFLERMGLTIQSTGNEVENISDQVSELLEPLSEYTAKLEQELFVLQQVAEGRQTAGMALLEYQEAQAQAQAVTEADTAAIRAKFAELRRLQGAIDDTKQATEEAAESEKKRQAIRDQALAFEEQVAALGQEIVALQGGEEAWNEYTRAMFISNEVAKLGPEATEAQVKAIQEAAAELFDLKKKIEDIADAGDPLEDLLSGFDDLGFKAIADDIGLVKDALKDATDPAVIARLENALGSLRQEMVEGLVGASVQALSSIQQLTETGSKEYKLIEVAIQAANVAAAIAAILNQGMGDVYTAPFRMAAMATAVAGLVGSIASVNFGGFGSDSTAEDRQRTQGTGSILGDSEAKSDSILRSSERQADALSKLVGISRNMLEALLGLQEAIAGASGMLARGAGQAEFSALPDVGAVVDPIGFAIDDALGISNPLSDFLNELSSWSFLAKALGGKAKVTDEGLAILAGSISDLINGDLIAAYQSIKSKKSIFHKTKRRDEFADIEDDVANQFSLLFASLVDAVVEGALALGLEGDEIQRAVDAYQVEAQKISLKDLSADEQQAELEAVFSSIFDGLAGEVVPFIRQFQEVGEGLGATLIRVATGVQVTQEGMRRLGFALDETDPEKFAQASEGLIGLIGGIDEFISGMTGFVDSFAPESVKARVAFEDVTRGLAQANLKLPETREGFWALMQSLDATTEAGREQIATMLRLRDAADTYYSSLEAVQDEREGLERRLLQLQGDTAALRALELEGLDESNRAIQERIWKLEDEQAATAELNQIMEGIESSIANLSFSPLTNEARDLTRSYSEQLQRMEELGASEEQFGRARLNYSLQVAALAAELEQSIMSLVDQFLGRDDSAFDSSFGSSFTGPIENAANTIRDSLIRALEGVEEWLRRSAFEDPSLTPRQQFNALETEFNRLIDIAMNGSGQAQVDAIAALPQLASQLEAMGVQMYGSATEPFGAFRDELIAAMEGVAGISVPEAVPDPVTGSQVGSIGASVEQAATSAEAQKLIAQQILQEIGALVSLGEGTAVEIAEHLGVPLADIIETLIGSVDEMTLETVEQLLAVASVLGMDLADVAAAIDVNIGELADQESLFSQALQARIDQMPNGIQRLLDPALQAIRDATNETDANAALEELRLITDKLPTEYKDLLSPFIEGIDPQEPLDVQIGLLEQLKVIEQDQLGAMNAVVEMLDRIRRGIGAQNEADGIPGFAAGGWVNSNQVIRAGEAGRELILPNPVSEFLAREGLPVQVQSRGNSGESPAELRRIADLLEAGNRDRVAGVERIESAQLAVATSMAEVAREARSMAGMNR